MVFTVWLSGAPTRFAGPNSPARRKAGSRGEQGFESRNAGGYDSYRSFKSVVYSRRASAFHGLGDEARLAKARNILTRAKCKR